MAEQDRKIRYALVGAGNIAQVAVLPAFEHAAGNSELVAIVSSNAEKRAQLAARYGLEHAGPYDAFDRVVREARADAVYLAVPNHLHREWTERAARAGLHILCEKPMATTVADCHAMIAAAQLARVKLMIAYRLHFEEANLRAIELARSGRLGEPRVLSATLTQRVRPGDIRTRAEVGGGALLDEGPYCVNAARYLFDAEPEEVFGYSDEGADPRSRGVDQTTVALLRFSEGRMAHFAVSQAAAKVSSFRLVGTLGDVRVDPAFSYATERRAVITVGDEIEERTYPTHDQFAPELIYFSRCILEGAEPEPSGVEGLADVRVLTAIQEAIRRARSIRLDPFPLKSRPDLSQLIVRPASRPPPMVDAPSPTAE
jgi:predicted dehydrogenase